MDSIDELEKMLLTNVSFDSDCLICANVLINEKRVLYKMIDSEWIPLKNICNDCVFSVLHNGWNLYIDKIKNADCSGALKRLLKTGSPINIRLSEFINEQLNSKEKNNELEFHEFYTNHEIISAKLDESLTGIERDVWIRNQQQFIEYLESSEGKKMIETDNV